MGNPVVCVTTRKGWEDQGVGQKILLAVGDLMNWVDTTTEENVRWPNGAFPHTNGYICPNMRKNEVLGSSRLTIKMSKRVKSLRLVQIGWCLASKDE